MLEPHADSLLDDANSHYSSAQIDEMPKVRLTDRQKQYIWLVGSFPYLIAQQGHGYRTAQLLYAIDEEEQRLVIFGYSTPFLWLERRGLVRRINNADAYDLTDEGEQVFKLLVARQEGLSLNRQIRKVRLAPKKEPGHA